jgi:bacteriocin-like protein
MKELSKKELTAVRGGFGFLVPFYEFVKEMLDPTSPLAKTSAYFSHYRAQMPANWTGLGH